MNTIKESYYKKNSLKLEAFGDDYDRNLVDIARIVGNLAELGSGSLMADSGVHSSNPELVKKNVQKAIQVISQKISDPNTLNEIIYILANQQ
jgi:hypothetical protein